MNSLLSDVLVPTDEELVSIEFLVKLREKLGNPPDIDSQAGLTLMDAVIGVWQKHCGQEAKDWIHDKALDLENEKSLHELNKSDVGLYNPVGYPHQLFQLIKTMFPDIKLQQKKTFQKLLKIYPTLFKTSNYA